MGNCCKGVSSAAVHDSDEWELPLAHNHKTVLFDGAASSDKNRLLPVSSTSSSSSPGREQVKIKVSKRELEDLISRIETQGLSSQQILARLILSRGGGDQFRGVFGEDDRRCWKPVLQSIPEVNLASDSFDCC
ncbi:hypothetical protein LINGRAPRIM_LOCUS574 [Linum grandiflorum]